MKDFYDDISKLCGLIQPLCTRESCPRMTAADYTYRWAGADGVLGKIHKPKEVSAPRYVENVILLVGAKTDGADYQRKSENTAGQEICTGDSPPQPKQLKSQRFRRECQLMFKYLFRLYAHIYHAHLHDFVKLGAETHLNTCCRRFVLFGLEFNLLAKKELAPLAQLIRSFEGKAKRSTRRLHASTSSMGSGSTFLHGDPYDSAASNALYDSDFSARSFSHDLTIPAPNVMLGRSD